MLQIQMTKWENLTDLGLTRPNQAHRIQLDMDLTNINIANHLAARTSRHLFRCVRSVINSHDCQEI